MKDLYPKQLEIVQAVAAMLGDVGITVNIKNLEIATAREARSAGNYDMFFSGWAHMPHDPDWYLGQWFTKAGAEKLTRYDNPRIEQLIAEGRMPDPKIRQQKYEEIEKALWEDEPEIWPYYSVAIYAVSDKLQNFRRAATTTSCSTTLASGSPTLAVPSGRPGPPSLRGGPPAARPAAGRARSPVRPPTR